ncbi:MAG: AsmA family protein, partial [Hyphomicrobiales bacterium]
MARALKRVLTAVVGLVGLAVVAAVVAPFVPVDGYRPRLEAAATRVLGLPVRIEGPMRLGLLPAPHVSVDGGRARKEGGALFASVRRTRLYPKLLPLVVGSFRLRRVDLDRPVLTVERSGSGGTNAIGLEQAAMLLGSLDGVRLEASHGTIVYADSSGRRQVEASGVRLSVRSERVAAAADTAAWRTSALDATIACDSIRAGGAVATGSVLTVHASSGLYDLTATRVHLFGGEAEGTLR